MIETPSASSSWAGIQTGSRSAKLAFSSACEKIQRDGLAAHETNILRRGTRPVTGRRDAHEHPRGRRSCTLVVRDSGAMNLPTPPSFEGLERREEVIAQTPQLSPEYVASPLETR